MGYSPWGCKESDMPEQLTHEEVTMDPQSRPIPFGECNHFPKTQCSVRRPYPTRVQEGAVGRSLETWGGLKSCLHGLHRQGHLLGLAEIGMLTLHFCFVICGVGMVASTCSWCFRHD